MTSKQLYKKLSSQQNRFISTRFGSFDLEYYNKEVIGEFFSIYIHGKSGEVIFHKHYIINDEKLNDKLQELKQFVDAILDY